LKACVQDVIVDSAAPDALDPLAVDHPAGRLRVCPGNAEAICV
jgi:hypothetical protein